MTIESTVLRANKEVENGQVWRAKEILGSAMVTYEYSRIIVRAHADVLMQMNNEFEAGKFYLLSVDEPNEIEKEVMDLFLSRHGKQNFRQLLSRFPKRARLAQRDDYPGYLRMHLVELGAPETLIAAESKRVSAVTAKEKFMDLAAQLGCAIIALSVFSCLLVGFFEIISWIGK